MNYLEKEEDEADNYAISVQKTSKYLNSAKAKIENFKFSRLCTSSKLQIK